MTGNRLAAPPLLLLLAGACLVPLLGVAPCGAQTGRGLAATDPDSALAAALRGIEGQPITLESALALAARGATAAREAEAALRAAKGALRREKGEFDPELFADVTRTSENSATASPFAGASVLETDETSTAAGARVTLPIGTEIEARLDATKSQTNSSFATLDPQYDTAGKISVRQPLLKGFGPSARGDLSAAERGLDAARASYDDALLAVRAQTETAYWDLYAAERDLAVQRLIVDRASAFLDQASSRADAGLVGPNEVANARVFQVEQELAALDREEALDAASDRLATLLGQRPEGGAMRYRPVDDPPHDFTSGEFGAGLLNEDRLSSLAREQNLEIRAARQNLEGLRARARGARWDAYPALDLTGSVGGTGLSGSPQTVIFGGDTLRTSIDGGFGDTWTQVRKREYPTWSLGFELTLPIGFRRDRGERDRLAAEVLRAEHELTALERRVDEDVRAGCRELANGARRLSLARDGVEASFEQVRVGLVEYQNGRSTAFELVRLGADLASAQQRYSQALVRTAKAAADLRRLTAEGLADAVPGAAGDERGSGR